MRALSGDEGCWRMKVAAGPHADHADRQPEDLHPPRQDRRHLLRPARQRSSRLRPTGLGIVEVRVVTHPP